MTGSPQAPELGSMDGIVTIPNGGCNEAVAVGDSEFVHEYANVLGVNVSAIDLDRAVEMADRWIAGKNRGYICVTGVHGIMEAQSDSELQHILNHAFLNTPDGMPMSWVGHLQGFSKMDRVFGPDLMASLCEISVERNYRHFLYGGETGVAELLKEKLESRFPGLQIVGTYTPPFRGLTAQEEEEIFDRLQVLRPHILWVGLSTPKQERFMARYIDRLQVPLLVGVGAAFDYHTARISDCSDWIKRAGLQWLHRLLQDPKRLWKRYLKNNPAFLWRIALQLCKLKHYPASR
ncbi:MAG TPA: WecB/TagA/CpsF family glycosyltransferase [Acidobacteriaceae bacterium]|nr:WecB/TagA/CpsF family glycosyltransferase [Acidobacteriaceae bacterium]